MHIYLCMRDIIKKIIKEETSDFEWTNLNAIKDDFRSWITKNYPWLKPGRIDTDGMISAPEWLLSDANELVSYGRIINNDKATLKERLEALGGFETYSALSSMIEDTRIYLKIIVGFSEEYGITENTSLELFLNWNSEKPN